MIRKTSHFNVKVNAVYSFDKQSTECEGENIQNVQDLHNVYAKNWYSIAKGIS